jgi:hypothetical protein
MSSRYEEPFACPTGIALWQECPSEPDRPRIRNSAGAGFEPATFGFRAHALAFPFA